MDQPLAVAVPELMAADEASSRPSGETLEDHRERKIEPDEGIRPHPDEIAHLEVITVHHPGVSPKRFLDPPAKDVGRRRRPSRLPVQRIQLDVWNPEAAGEGAGKGRLTGAGRSDDGDAPWTCREGRKLRQAGPVLRVLLVVRERPARPRPRAIPAPVDEAPALRPGSRRG